MSLPKLGSGARFAKLTSILSKNKDITNPEAVAASIGRKKYGNEKMNSLAKAGKKRKEGY